MRKPFGFVASVVSLALIAGPLNAAAPKAGSKCSKVGATSTYAGKKYTCVKSGTKLVWNKGAVVKTAAPKPSVSPTPAPVAPVIAKAPSTFDDLFENRKGVSYAAWLKVSETVKANKTKVGTWEVFTGPNTKPAFEGYPLALDLVSRAFPKNAEPTQILIIRYNFKDLDWATNLLKGKISAQDYADLDRNAGGKLVSSNCEIQASICRGSKQQTVFSSGLALILQGVDNSTNNFDLTAAQVFGTGMLEAHEYFHSLQRIPIMGKSDVWPHAWFREGSAAWVQNVTINYENFDAYKTFLRLDCQGQCFSLTEAQIIDVLQRANENNFPGGYDQFLNYNLGSRFIEILVALKGQESIIEMYAQMGKKISFNEAFKNVYGVEFIYAIPILAKTVHANIRNQ